MKVPEEYVDWRTRGVWWPGPPVRLAEFAAARHDLFGGAFTWPVMVAQRTALEHNIETLAGYCARHGVSFAPHGKTTMAPALFAAQLRAGAWAITAATAAQVLAMRSFGVPRVLLANELLDPAPLRWLAGEVAAGFEFYCQVDSAAAVAAMTDVLADAPTRLAVLVELGFPGGRTGCRTVADAVDVARAVGASPRLALAGVTGYEGGLPDVAAVTGFLDEMATAVHALASAGLLPDTVIVSAGGSAFFDVAARGLAGLAVPGHSIRPVLRSGAYVSHDDGLYRERTPFRRDPAAGSLRAALQVWARVTSVPEPGLAIVGMGKREVSYDAGLPVPRYVRRADGPIAPADGLTVTALNDHHGYVAGTGLQPGDLVGFGISHPCTAFEKWPVIPVVEDDYTVSDLIRTYF
jgi:D-serine deaminase-like pyridoxal phosphate-dependent protein